MVEKFPYATGVILSGYTERADLIAFLVSPRASWVTGTCINVDGGQTVSIN